ncbi:hypothetical protein JOM56_000859 [Amanita muscaria]
MIEWHTNWDKPFLGGNVKTENVELLSSVSSRASLSALSSISTNASTNASTSASTNTSASVSSSVSASASSSVSAGASSSISASVSPNMSLNALKRPTTDHVASRKKAKYKNKDFVMPEVRNPLAFSKAQVTLTVPTIRSPRKTVSTAQESTNITQNTHEVDSEPERDCEDLDKRFEESQVRGKWFQAWAHLQLIAQELRPINPLNMARRRLTTTKKIMLRSSNL